jgi:hypothetical protein
MQLVQATLLHYLVGAGRFGPEGMREKVVPPLPGVGGPGIAAGGVLCGRGAEMNYMPGASDVSHSRVRPTSGATAWTVATSDARFPAWRAALAGSVAGWRECWQGSLRSGE